MKAEYTIITDLKHSLFFRRNFRKVKNCVLLFVFTLQTLLLKKKKVEKIQEKIAKLKRYEGYELYHNALVESMFKGFNDLNIPCTFNKITKDTKNVILSWCDREDLKIVQKLKRDGKIKKVVTTPIACKYDYDFQYIFPEYDCIDRVLVASENTKNMFYKKRVKKNIEKVISWSSGVEIPESNNEKIEFDCLCYYKRLPINSDLENLLNSKNIKFKNIEYYHYNFEDWIKLLDQVNFVIFFQDYIETQGLAMAEAWAHNRPTLIKTKDKIGIEKTSPYLTDEAGLFFETLEELDAYLQEYVDNKEKFLSRFSPKNYVEKNFSNKISVLNLIDIFNNIKG